MLMGGTQEVFLPRAYHACTTYQGVQSANLYMQLSASLRMLCCCTHSLLGLCFAQKTWPDLTCYHLPSSRKCSCPACDGLLPQIRSCTTCAAALRLLATDRAWRTASYVACQRRVAVGCRCACCTLSKATRISACHSRAKGLHAGSQHNIFHHHILGGARMRINSWRSLNCI